MAPQPHPLIPHVLGVTEAIGSLDMKTERFTNHNEATEALLLSASSVTAIMLAAYLLLLTFY